MQYITVLYIEPHGYISRGDITAVKLQYWLVDARQTLLAATDPFLWLFNRPFGSFPPSFPRCVFGCLADKTLALKKIKMSKQCSFCSCTGWKGNVCSRLSYYTRIPHLRLRWKSKKFFFSRCILLITKIKLFRGTHWSKFGSFLFLKNGDKVSRSF